MGLQIATSSNC